MTKCHICNDLYDETSAIEQMMHLHLAPLIKNKKDSEKKIEPRLREEVNAKGGECLKFVSPGNGGVPDRIILMPNKVDFVELKSKGLTLDPLQEWWHKRLRELGFDPKIIDTQKKLDEYLATL